MDVRSAELDNTAVPLPFEIYATICSEQYEKIEKFKRESPDKYVNCKVVVDALEKRIETKDVKVFEI